jgi:hypothetical protein
MAEKSWKTLKVQFCDHVGQEVALEVEAVYPPEHLPDQPPRLAGHRCSLGMACNIKNKAACVWSGGNPNFDPFER